MTFEKRLYKFGGGEMNEELKKVLDATYAELWKLYQSKELNLWDTNDDELFVADILDKIDDYLQKDGYFRGVQE
jgi:5'-deoxynucleotidase YfbR-like HD superfamily hydrolase